tara:strand:- start:3063 stop:3521 length:459 start_codon:yes stop_codon:yes gene_type:complete
MVTTTPRYNKLWKPKTSTDAITIKISETGFKAVAWYTNYSEDLSRLTMLWKKDVAKQTVLIRKSYLKDLTHTLENYLWKVPPGYRGQFGNALAFFHKDLTRDDWNKSKQVNWEKALQSHLKKGYHVCGGKHLDGHDVDMWIPMLRRLSLLTK